MFRSLLLRRDYRRIASRDEKRAPRRNPLIRGSSKFEPRVRSRNARATEWTEAVDTPARLSLAACVIAAKNSHLRNEESAEAEDCREVKHKP